VSNPSFIVPVADLERGPREVSWTVSTAWLAQAFEGTEAEPLEEGRLTATLTKSGSEVLVRGRVRARVTMPDAATSEPVEIPLDSEVFLMLAPAPSAEPAGRKSRRGGRRQAAPEGKAPKKKGGWSEDSELADADAAQDTYSDDQIVLDPFVREFLLLELPMVARKDLRSGPPPAIAPPSPAPEGEQPRQVDPRLAPLAAIAERMRGRKD